MELQQKTEFKPMKPVYKNPFHCSGRVVKGAAKLDLDDHWFVKSMELDKDTLCAVPVFDRSSWQEEIESNRENCGMELMRKQLRQGLIKAEDLYDDGKSGFDTAVVPATVHDAKKKSDELNDALAGLSKELGVSEKEELTADLLIDRLTQRIQQKFNEAKAASEVKSNEQ